MIFGGGGPEVGLVGFECTRESIVMICGGPFFLYCKRKWFSISFYQWTIMYVTRTVSSSGLPRHLATASQYLTAARSIGSAG